MLSLLWAAQVAAVASDPAPAPSVAPSAVAEAPASIMLPALTNVRIRVLADLGYVVPAGTRGRGWVIHADKARFGGKAGELLLGARYLKLGDVEIPLRSMKLGARPPRTTAGWRRA